jgi:hypothetical protein
MADRSDEYRAAASECLRLARMTSDENARTSLLVMAQKWFDLANGPRGQDALDVAVRAFNDWQMSPQSSTSLKAPRPTKAPVHPGGGIGYQKRFLTGQASPLVIFVPGFFMKTYFVNLPKASEKNPS